MTIPLATVWSSKEHRWQSPDGRFYFDTAAADTAADFFPDLLRHHMGEFAGRPFTLMPYQRHLLTRPLFGWKRAHDGMRRFRRVFAFIPKGGGKALALDTPIATPSGWTDMGSVRVGDRVFDERGRVVDVMAASEVMAGRPCFNVTFDDGQSIVADADHLWWTEVRRHSRAEPRWGVRTTREVLSSLRVPNGRYRSANHSIPLAAPIACPTSRLPIDPYVLGVWLGDGDADAARITVGDADVELLEHVAACGVAVSKQAGHSYRYGIGKRFGGACSRGHDRSERSGGHCRACERIADRARRRGDDLPAATNRSLVEELRSIGVLKNKHVPAAYLRAGIEQRLALLQGLMDTDGYIDPDTGNCEFCTTDRDIRDGIVELMTSLGVKVNPRESAAKLNGREVSRRWRMCFMPPADLPVFRLTRKLRHQHHRHSRRRLSADRRIVSVTPVESVPVRCITVSGPSSLFLAGRGMVPTHNSPWAAGTGVYLARCDGEMAAEVYALANDRNQARTVHTNAKYMIEDSPLLLEGCEILKDSIYWLDTRSAYMVLSSDASSAHGKRPHGLIFDELHGFSGAKDRELFEALKKSLVKRRQPVLIMITHSGVDDESLCFEEYSYAKGVLSGQLEDDACLPVVFEAQPDDDWTSAKVHARVNPGYGITVKADAVEAECQEAINQPSKMNDFLRYHLNRWVNQATAWIPVDWWDQVKDVAVPTDEELAPLAVAAGLDLAQKWDLAALTLVFRVPIASAIRAEVVTETAGAVETKSIDLNYRVVLVPFFWIPEDTLREHEARDRVPYQAWADAGLLTVTDGATIDYSRIYRDITETIVERFPRLKQGIIGYDPAFATDIASQLRDRAGLPCEEVLQNYTHLSEPCHIFEALVKAGRVTHGGHRILRNHVEHVAVKKDDAGRMRPVKPKQAGKHIDGVVATLMGLKMLATIPDEAADPFSFFFLGGGTHGEATT